MTKIIAIVVALLALTAPISTACADEVKQSLLIRVAEIQNVQDQTNAAFHVMAATQAQLAEKQRLVEVKLEKETRERKAADLHLDGKIDDVAQKSLKGDMILDGAIADKEAELERLRAEYERLVRERDQGKKR